MQIVIDIDDNLYTRLFDNGDEYVADMRRACVAIRKGRPHPKTGHWIYCRNNKGDWVNGCSVCGSDAGVGYQYPYCPNCGAKMESEEE